MSPAFAGSQFALFFTHSLRCGLEECRQLCWLTKNFAPQLLWLNVQSTVHSRGRLCHTRVACHRESCPDTCLVLAKSCPIIFQRPAVPLLTVALFFKPNFLRASFSACCTRRGAVPPATSWQASTASTVK